MATVEGDAFYLGGEIDPATGERRPSSVGYEPADLTTHGVIVGMTGSGKTGLGIIYLEEALLAGIPSVVIDPKGDMTNLLLTFPDLAPSDFEPWVDQAEARTKGVSVADLAAEKAALWSDGLAGWDLGEERIRALKDAAEFVVHTPGSGAGVGLNIVGSLACPDLDWDTGEEVLRDEIQGFVSGLLGLVGVEADPIASREHILLANLVEASWRQGVDLDLALLLGQIKDPPFRKLGVFELDAFFPEKERVALAMKLNGLVASPAFSAWMQGDPLDVERLLHRPGGKPRASIIYLAHLSDEERQFVVTLVLSRIVTWMRAQPGSSDLRALVYMDEVFGYVPPTAEPPAKKPILTMLKQARAYGVGMLLSTQNPVDLDYKAMSNAGTWCVGRLQTERDKARILEALQSARGDTDLPGLDSAISSLDSRQFLLHRTGRPDPVTFTTRWALSYLAGPLTRDQVTRLMAREAPGTGSREPRTPPESPDTAPPGVSEPSEPRSGEDETPVMPAVADGMAVRHVTAGAPWLEAVGGRPTATTHVAAIAARVAMRYDDTTTGVDHTEEWEAVFTPLAQPFDAGTSVDVDYDERDLTDQAPATASYRVTDARIDTKTYFAEAERAIRDRLLGQRTTSVFRNPHLKLSSRVGEDEASFLQRCDEAAQHRADEEVARLRDTYRAKIDRVTEQMVAAERRAEELAVDLQGARDTQLLDQAGAVLGVLLGRRSTRAITGSARSRAAARSKEQRLVTAQEKARDKATALTALEEELRLELEQINDTWEARGSEIEPVEIRLEKSDITVLELALVWIPV